MKYALYLKFLAQKKRNYETEPHFRGSDPSDRPRKFRTRGKKSGEPVSGDKRLAIRIKFLLDKYKDRPELVNQILIETRMYEVNRTIARDLKSVEAEEQLTEEFINFLNSI